MDKKELEKSIEKTVLKMAMDPKNTDLYQDFIRENPDVGYLKVQAFTAYGAIPIPNTSIIITKDIDTEVFKILFCHLYI